MNKLPLKIGTLHFIGIGGIGMSGIAEVLHHLGYTVQGSDLSDSANVKRLRALGITVKTGHTPDNIFDNDDNPVYAVVRSSAVKLENPEMVAAQESNIPIIRRAEMLAEIMRFKSSIAIAGTHGKTTTTSLVGHLLESADKDPTIINGGIINSYGTNTRMGNGDWMVVEADESDGTFTQLPAIAGVITNIDPEHLDHYGSFDALKDSFKRFVTNLPFYGFVVACTDHPVVKELIPSLPRKVVSYGFNDDADVQARNITTDENGAEFDVYFKATDTVERMALPMHGAHNILNSLAAIAVAAELDITPAQIKSALLSFEGVKRRFTKTGVAGGITVIDDYAHHPVEIQAVLKAARSALNNKGRLIAVAQPHRYSRLADLFEEFSNCFEEADHIVITDIFEAGESPIADADKQALVNAIKKTGKTNVEGLSSEADLPRLIHDIAKSGDMVICLGAGSITTWANNLPDALDKIMSDAQQHSA